MKLHALVDVACPVGCGGILAYQFETPPGDVYRCPVCSAREAIVAGGSLHVQGIFLHHHLKGSSRCGIRRLWHKNGPFARECFTEPKGKKRRTKS